MIPVTQQRKRLMTREQQNTPENREATPIDFEAAVELHYDALYRFAFGLAGKASDAADLTQETYRTLLVKSDQIRDRDKVKSWLFTTLYRYFLRTRRRITKFPEVELDAVEPEMPAVDAIQVDNADSKMIIEALQSLDEMFRAPLVMFYLQDFG